MAFGQLQNQLDQTETGGPPLVPDAVALKKTNDASGVGKTEITATPIRTDPNFYADPKDFRREDKRAQTLCLDLTAATHDLLNDVRVGRLPDIDLVTKPLANMVKSVLRHPCAFVWAARLHSNQTYLCTHAVRSAVLSVVVGRRIGLELDSLITLAQGSLLCQIGKSKLPKHLLEKPGKCSSAELKRIRRHVGVGTALLKKCRNNNPLVVEIVQNHCERFNGTGYPQGKKGDEIPLLARVAGLVDCYDAMTNVRPHTDQVMSPSDNIKFLFVQRDVLFQRQLVEEFNQALGIYPTGTLVELNNGQVALVRQQNETSRLQPKILLVLDENKRPLNKLSSLDLKEHNQHFKNQPLAISCALGINEYSLNPTQLMHQYSGQSRRWSRLIGR